MLGTDFNAVTMQVLQFTSALVPKLLRNRGFYSTTGTWRPVRLSKHKNGCLPVSEYQPQRSNFPKNNPRASHVFQGIGKPKRVPKCLVTEVSSRSYDGEPFPRSLILGIETSCDETGAAVVSTDGQVLGEALASQAELHAQWGGVVPALAQGEHVKAIDGVVAEALAKAGVGEAELAAVAVTIGPGLGMCLQVGVRKARAISRTFQIPFVAVHHMEAHALVARLDEPSLQFPFLLLLISGGHNLLLLAHGVSRYSQLGASLDDAIGEAFDKVARLLGLDLSRGGGPAVEAIAKSGNPKRYKFSVPMRSTKTCDFSYAGLKTAVRMAVDADFPGAEQQPLEEDTAEARQIRADIAASFQHVAIQHLEDRTRRAISMAREMAPAVTSLVMAGGVAANCEVRQRMAAVAEEGGLRLICPPLPLCTDNGVMVAWAGAELFRLGRTSVAPSLDEPELERVDIRPRWPLGESVDKETSGIRSMKRREVFPSLTQLTQLALPAASNSAT